MKFIHLIIITFILSGCASTPQYTNEGIPKPEYMIGGGEIFIGQASTDGRFVVVEETTKRIFSTVDVKKGQRLSYKASEDALTEQGKTFEEDIGIPYSEARFAAYLIPNS